MDVSVAHVPEGADAGIGDFPVNDGVGLFVELGDEVHRHGNIVLDRNTMRFLGRRQGLPDRPEIGLLGHVLGNGCIGDGFAVIRLGQYLFHEVACIFASPARGYLGHDIPGVRVSKRIAQLVGVGKNELQADAGQNFKGGQ